MNLIIVESPTKSRTLSRFLGEDYKVEATCGHIKDLPKNKLGVDIKHEFEPDYIWVEGRKKEIERIKSLGKKSEKIFIATDPDREGEAIAQHVVDVLVSDSDSRVQNSKISRIVFHEITKEALEEALRNPRLVDKNLVDAQITRRVLDRLVGYQLSPLLWKKVRRGLSAGRVQSVAVRLIVEREREIKAFKPQEYWEIYTKLKTQKPKLKTKELITKLIRIGDKKAEVKNKDDADKIISELKKAEYTVLLVQKREIIKHPPAPFTTSTMTQSAARIFGWSAKRTMRVAQSLYEEGFITYHRTDSVNLAKSAILKVRKFIEAKYGKNYLPQKPNFYKKASKVAQEAHEAIRPTQLSSKLKIKNSKFSKELEMLYQLIWKRFVACQMTPAIYDETRIDVKAAPKDVFCVTFYVLRATGQTMKFDGWKKVYNENSNLQNTENEVQLPEVLKGEPLYLIKVWGDQKFTQPPQRYNEASLIKTLEKLGIGRPSTYAPIISTIQIRNYVEKKEGRFFPTAIGIAVNDFLLKNFPDIFDYQFTAQMEENLDEIANGKQKRLRIIKNFWLPFDKKLEIVEKKSERVKIETEKLEKKCPKCKEGELVIRTGRFGKFISCSRFPDCDYKEKYVQKVGVKCPECKKGEVIIKKTSKGRQFYGCSRYPSCKWASWKSPEISKN